MQRISKLLRWGNLVTILLTFVSYLSPFINPASFWPLTFFGMAYPWLLLVNILFVLWWLFRKDRYLFFSLACIFLGWNHLTGFIGWQSPDSYDPEKVISILTYNIQSGLEYQKIKELKRIGDGPLFDVLHKSRPNSLLCFQEIRRQYLKELSEELKYPHFHVLPKASAAILSPLPFLAKGGKRFQNSANSYLWVDVSIDNQRIRLFNVHLQSNKVSVVTDKVLQEGHLQEKETWRDIRTVISKIKSATQARSRQAKALAQEIAASPYPVIVCGDFNDTPQSFSYHLLRQGLKDTFREKGQGFGTTYAGGIPALRIDYILTDPKFMVLDNQIPKVPFSDHYPVISHITFDKK